MEHIEQTEKSEIVNEINTLLQRFHEIKPDLPEPLQFAIDNLIEKKEFDSEKDINFVKIVYFFEVYLRFLIVFFLTIQDDSDPEKYCRSIKLNDRSTSGEFGKTCKTVFEKIKGEFAGGIYFNKFDELTRSLSAIRNDWLHENQTQPLELKTIKSFIDKLFQLINETKIGEPKISKCSSYVKINNTIYCRALIQFNKKNYHSFPFFILYECTESGDINDIYLMKDYKELSGIKHSNKSIKISSDNFIKEKWFSSNQAKIYDAFFKITKKKPPKKPPIARQDNWFNKILRYISEHIPEKVLNRLPQTIQNRIASLNALPTSEPLPERSGILIEDDIYGISRFTCSSSDCDTIIDLSNICMNHRDNISKLIGYKLNDNKYHFERRNGIPVSKLIDKLNDVYMRKSGWGKHKKLIISITLALISVLLSIPATIILVNLLSPKDHFLINIAIGVLVLTLSILAAIYIFIRLNNDFKISKLNMNDLETAVKEAKQEISDTDRIKENSRHFRKASKQSPVDILILRQYGKLLNLFQTINLNDKKKYTIKGINPDNVLFDLESYNFFLLPLIPTDTFYDIKPENDKDDKGHIKPLAQILGKLLSLDKNYSPDIKKSRFLFQNTVVIKIKEAIDKNMTISAFIEFIENLRDRKSIRLYSKTNLKMAILILCVFPAAIFLMGRLDYVQTTHAIKTAFAQDNYDQIPETLEKYGLDQVTLRKFIDQKKSGSFQTAKNIIKTRNTKDLVPIYYIDYFRFPEKRMASIADKFFNRGFYDNATQYYDLILQYNSVDDNRKLQEIQKRDWAPNRAICYYNAGDIEKAYKIFEAFDDKMLNPHQKEIKKSVAGQIHKDIESLCKEAREYYTKKKWRRCLELCSAIINRYSNSDSDRSGKEINYNSWIQAHLYSAESKYRIDKQKGQYDPAELLYRVRNHILRAHEIAASARGLKKPLDYRSIQEDIHTTELNIYLHIFRDTLEQNPEKGLEIFKEVYTKSVPEQEQKGVFKTIIDYVDAKHRIENDLSKSSNSHKNLSNKIVSLKRQLEENANTLSSERQALKTQIENLKAELSQKDDLEKIVHRMSEIEKNIITQLKGEHSGLGETLNRSFRQSIRDIQTSIDQWRVQYSNPQPAETSAE